MTLSVRVRAAVFDGSTPEGFGFKIVDFEGWNDSVDVRRERIEIPNAHGDFDLPGLRGSRVTRMSGFCRSESLRQQQWHRSVLTGLLADGDADRVVVEESGETQWANVRLATRPTFERNSFSKYADWELALWAANPRKFGETRTFGPASSISAYHFGNFPAAPVLTVAGSSAGGYTINGPAGRTFVVTHALVSGQPHTIDMATGRLTVNGAVVTGGIATARTWAVPPGTKVAMSVTAGLISAAVVDTFI